VQGLLKLGDKTLLGVIVPVMLLALLFAVPYLDFNPHRRLRKRPLALLLSLAAIVALAVLSYMGTHEYGIELPAATRIVQNLAPEEGEGPLQAVPFEQLAVGIYTIDETDAADLPPALDAVFTDFERQVNQAEAEGQFSETQGVMIVEDWQAGLKRVTLRLTWTDPASQTPKMQERIVHLHRDRLRSQERGD
jgi:hypothetical protein